MALRGRTPHHVALPKLRAAREARGWSEEDLAVAVLDLCEELGEPTPGISAGQVSKWERGDRNPGPFYRARLAVALETTPTALGFAATPTLMRSIRDLMDHRRTAGSSAAPQRHMHRRQSVGLAVPGLDQERLHATLAHLWPADGPLVTGLERAASHLAARRDMEPPYAVVSDLARLLDLLIVLLSRSQPLGPQLQRVAAGVGQNLAMASWVSGDAAETYRKYAVAEALARDSQSGAHLATILVDRSEMAGQRARSSPEWAEAKALADAAETAARMDADTPLGVLVWIYGERALFNAELGDDAASGSDIERLESVRRDAAPDELNIFSPGVDSVWADIYHARRAVRLGQSEHAITLSKAVLDRTDPRLAWERAEALTQLADAWTLGGEPIEAATALRDAIELLRATGNERDLRSVKRILNQIRGRWRSLPEVRELVELLRSVT